MLESNWREAVEARMDAHNLTRRRRDVAWCVLAGMSNAEIGDALYMSTKTAKNYICDICDRLEIESGHNISRRIKLTLTLLGIDYDALRVFMLGNLVGEHTWTTSTRRSSSSLAARPSSAQSPAP